MAFSAGAGHGRASRVGLQRSRVGEAGSVVPDLGENPCAGERSESWLAGDDLGVGVPIELLGRGTQIACLFLPVRINGDVAVLKGIMKEMLEMDAYLMRPAAVQFAFN